MGLLADPTMLVILAVAALAGLVLAWRPISAATRAGASGLGGLFKQPTVVLPKEADDVDVLDLKALRRLQARFERLGCKEGQTAVQVSYAHFFHAAGDHL